MKESCKKSGRTFSPAGKAVLMAMILISTSAMLHAEETDALLPSAPQGPRTGVFQWEGLKSPVWVVVPQELDLKRSYPLYISIPGPGEKIEEHANSWAALADKNNFLVMVPTLEIRSGEVSDAHDEWILGIERQIVAAYPVAKHKIFVMGFDQNAMYAAGLAFNHPQEFAAVAFLGGSWVGPFEKDIRFRTQPKAQLPVYVALRGDKTVTSTQVEASAQKLQHKGYLVHMEMLQADENFKSKEFRSRVLGWLMENSDIWQDVVDKANKTWKQKTRNFFEENFFIR